MILFRLTLSNTGLTDAAAITSLLCKARLCKPCLREHRSPTCMYRYTCQQSTCKAAEKLVCQAHLDGAP